jgi:hypothetical protein
MIQHSLVLLVCLPLMVLLGAWNTRKKVFTPGEIRFWGVAIFVASEFVYLGMS